MTASATPQPAVRETLAALIDYAGLFPPAELAVDLAVREYVLARRGAYAWMLGRFIVRLSQIDALLAAMPAGEQFALSVILDTGDAGLEQVDVLRRSVSNISIEALEVTLDPPEVSKFAREFWMRTSLCDLPVYVEGPLSGVSALATAGLRAKLRCGGQTQSAYPSPADLAAFLKTCADLRLAFKATAGLHHPVRHFNREAGVTMHGFLNLLGGAACAFYGAAPGEIESIIACEDADAFAFERDSVLFCEQTFTGAQMRDVRSGMFVSYGSCSFSEPVDGLQSMGVL